jgi:hypothetical protein
MVSRELIRRNSCKWSARGGLGGSHDPSCLRTYCIARNRHWTCFVQQRCPDMCQQKEDLLLIYTDTLNAILGHLPLQADAVSSGDPDYGRYDSTIEAVERRKKEAAQAYSAHAAQQAISMRRSARDRNP